MTKSELAFHAGVSTRTFSRWLTQHRERLRELGIKPANRIPLKRDSVFFLPVQLYLFNQVFYLNQPFVMSTESNKKLSWAQVVNAVVQALIAALTALGVSSCSPAILSLL